MNFDELFPMTTTDEALRKAHTKPKFVIDGFLATGSTLMYGTPEAGKSLMTSGLIASLVTGEPFLGREVIGKPRKVAVCWTDDDGDVEYARRLDAVTEDPNVLYIRMPVMRNEEMWQYLYEKIQSAGCDFVIFDVLTQMINGSVKNDEDVADFFNGVRMFTRNGIDTLIITHSSEKRQENGYVPKYPLGSTTLAGSVRWNIYLKKSSTGEWTAEQHGKRGKPFTVKFRSDEYDVPEFYITTEKNDDQVRNEAIQRQRTYDAEKLNKNLDYARFVVENCQGMSQRQAAEKLAEKFGGSSETMRNLFKRKSLPVVQSDGRWSLTEEATIRLVS